MRRGSQFRLAAAVLLAGVALLGASCGGDEEEGAAPPAAAGAPPESAALVGAETPIFVSLDTDFDGEQWQAAEALIERLASEGQGLDDALNSLAGEGLDFEQDVKPALGPEVGIAVLEVPVDGGTPPFVLITKPADPAKLQALIARADEPPISRELEDGWVVLAESQEHIDQALATGGTALSADPGFASALAAIPGDSVVRLYLNGAPLTALLQQSFEQSGTGFDLGTLTGAGTLKSVALALSAQEAGFRLDGIATTEGGPEVTTYEPQLTAVAPPGAILFASFSNVRAGVDQFLDMVAEQTPDFAQQLGQVEAALGVSLENDLLPLFEGEHALYVREGLPIPEITLLLSPADPAKGLATLDQIALGASDLAAQAGETAPFTVTSTDIAGTPAKQVTIGDTGFSLYYAQVGDNLVLTSGVSGIADLVAGAGSLAEDERFVAATETAGLPGQTSGFLFLDFERATSLIELFTSTLESGSVTVPPEGVDALGALGYLVVHAGGSGNTTTFAGFLGVK